ncbi:GlxA family transcriptional regulator [Aliiroseovarius sp. S1339]|uniref:GlxA family transcriptional regulator n=1 Tax=Aliiroseovarius sp. S1339 TaxID=2936990 RepID=UPI0020BFC89D|nr:GlxA family transcriptional regulator [Aliiroseovarius sp. S1339]MCK8463735.1 GlxA family transcriptional regulator [Aliiroseovarius sp. S1339]
MQNWSKSSTKTRKIGFLLYDRFSNMALANLLEPLRATNTLVGHSAFEWQICTPDDWVVHSSSGLPIMPTARLSDIGQGDFLFAICSYDHQTHATPANAKILRALAGRFQTMVGVDTGGWVLAAAGLLDGCRATIHFDLLDAFGERFPSIEVERARWVRDGNRITCSGGMAAYDLTCELIGEDHGAALLLELTQMFMSESVTAPHALARVRGDRRVEACLREMEANIETPLPIPELARRSGCRQRDLEQRFERHFGASPQKVYRRLRLNSARRMLEAGGLSIAEVALRAGYADASAFSRAFRVEFGLSPRVVARGAAITAGAQPR